MEAIRTQQIARALAARALAARALAARALAVLLLACSALGGCAFSDAAAFGPNFSKIEIGTKRAIVEKELGNPRARVLSKPGMSVDIYEYRVNDNPSRLRALGNLAKSIFTLGIWEFWSNERTTAYRLRIVYDNKQRVSEIRQVDIFADQVYEGAQK